ncbi:VPS29 [[Candida] subhashii]|uniref:Vacuolar protein sorting-associated protein 29 n=1 Tax=[Candida] subhashii TaxID=561895 RepID=A0A8J5Q7N6_9ASCO|nr:VPS29 [[Candida] subhashii]KAG7662594.1 VPS29 [[Candida] subhashii]
MLTLAIGDLFIPERSINLPSKFKKLLCPNPNSIPTNNKISRVVCLGNITNSQKTLEFLHNLSPQFSIVKGEFDNSVILSQQLSLISKKEEPIPYYNVFVCDGLRIGYTNGFQIVPRGDPLSLSAFARELDVDVLIWGGTHKVEAYTLDGKFFINPGSATGALSFDWPDNEDYEEEHQDQPKEEIDKESNEEKGSNEEAEKREAIEQDKDVTEDNKINKGILNEVEEMNANIPSFCLLDAQGNTCVLYIYTYLNGEVKVDKVTYTKE